MSGSARTLFYVLVNSTTEGMSLYARLREAGCKVRVAPAPRGATTCCGVSLAVEPQDIDAVRAALDADPSLAFDRIVELENAVDPSRDVYC